MKAGFFYGAPAWVRSCGCKPDHELITANAKRVAVGRKRGAKLRADEQEPDRKRCRAGRTGHKPRSSRDQRETEVAESTSRRLRHRAGRNTSPPGPTASTARCGTACRVVWEGAVRNPDRPYADWRPQVMALNAGRFHMAEVTGRGLQHASWIANQGGRSRSTGSGFGLRIHFLGPRRRQCTFCRGPQSGVGQPCGRFYVSMQASFRYLGR